MEERFWAKVNKTAACWEWTASKHSTGYGQFSGNQNGAHRIAYTLCIDPIPEGMEVDHICHNRGCVNPAHLRLATHQENGRYITNRADNLSGKTGVHWSKGKSKWKAQIFFGGKNQHLGYFVDLAVAIKARQAAEAEMFGAFAPN